MSTLSTNNYEYEHYYSLIKSNSTYVLNTSKNKFQGNTI